MTNAARASKEIRSKERIAAEGREHERRENKLNRAKDLSIANQQADTAIKSATINAMGRIGSSAMNKASFPNWGGSMKVPSHNDASFYKKYLTNADVFTKVPTFDRVGNNTFRGRYNYHGNTACQSNVPGIITLHWIPTVGPQNNGTAYFRNAVNQSLARTKEKVLALNSRSSVSWEAADLGYNLFCSADIATMILDLRRVIQAYQTYYPRNQYFAKSLVEAMGWSFTDLEANFADYRKTYSILARKFNSAIIAPKELSLYQRRIFLASNVFIDSADAKNPRQMYVYVQDACLRLADTEEFCLCQNITGLRTLAQWTVAIQLNMARITDSPAFIEMYQDLRHAFGDDIVQLPVDIESEELMLNNIAVNIEQIHNTVAAYVLGNGVVPHFPNMNGFNVCQDSDGYLYQGKTSGSWADRKLDYTDDTLGAFKPATIEALFGDSCKLMFNMHKTEVSGDDILDITRNAFTGAVTVNSDGTSSQLVESCGTEIILHCDIHAIGEDTGSPDDNIIWRYGRYNFCKHAVCDEMINIAALRSAFDWAPIAHSYFIDSTSEEAYATFMDAYTTFFIDRDSLLKIHDLCVMSELYLPDAGYKR